MARTILTLLLGLVLVCQSIVGAPIAHGTETNIPERPPLLTKRYDSEHLSGQRGPGPSVDPYPTDEDISRATIVTGDVPYVFWTEVADDRGEAAARSFAERVRGVYIGNLLPERYICMNDRDESWYNRFVDRVSGIYADRAVNSIYLVTSSFQGLTRLSTFVRIEAPTLVARGLY